MKAAIFDVDGTLIDSVDLHARAWQQAFQHFGMNIPFEKLRSQIGKGGDQLMPVFLSPDQVKAEGKDLESYRSALFKREHLAQVKPFAAVRDLFLRLRQDGWQIALASSAKEDELSIYKDLCHVGDLLEAQTSSDDAEKSKPHPDIFQAAARRLDIAPGECVVIGDSPYDAEAAGKAGMTTVGLLSGGFPAESRRDAGCVEIYKDPADVLSGYPTTVFGRQAPRVAGGA